MFILLKLASEELTAKRENAIKLKETIYETLGKAWPANSSGTQEKYRKLFVNHCATCLPTNTRSVQVCVVTALCNYVDKLLLLSCDQLTKEEEEILGQIVDDIIKADTYALGNYFFLSVFCLYLINYNIFYEWGDLKYVLSHL